MSRHGTPEAARRREARFLWAAVLTTVTMIAEAIGGVISGSLALLADAGHMFVDSSALLLAWLGARLARRPPDARRSFGYARLEVLAGFVNALTMYALVAWIVWEAIERMREPTPILSGVMLTVALAGLAVNLLVLGVLGGHAHHGHAHGHDQSHGHEHGSAHEHEHRHESHDGHAQEQRPGHGAAPPNSDDVNLQGARLHVIGDLLGSLAAVAAALIVRYTGWTPIDPILSVLVGALILVSATRLLRRTGHILLEGVPEGLDLRRLTATLSASHPAIADVHHLHIWTLGAGRVAATLHLRLHEPQQFHSAQTAVRHLLAERHGIDHVTIQLDADNCPDRSCASPGA